MVAAASIASPMRTGNASMCSGMRARQGGRPPRAPGRPCGPHSGLELDAMRRRVGKRPTSARVKLSGKDFHAGMKSVHGASRCRSRTACAAARKSTPWLSRSSRISRNSPRARELFVR